MSMRIPRQIVFSVSALFLTVVTGLATMRVVQKEISVSRALAGHVLVQGTDAPADGVTVELCSSDWKTVLASTKTDEKGRFSLVKPASGNCSISGCRHQVWIFTNFEFVSTSMQRTTWRSTSVSPLEQPLSRSCTVVREVKADALVPHVCSQVSDFQNFPLI
jgi:5-hydroxyisourate hydrolase-like protein (transthyretin family)